MTFLFTPSTSFWRFAGPNSTLTNHKFQTWHKALWSWPTTKHPAVHNLWFHPSIHWFYQFPNLQQFELLVGGFCLSDSVSYSESKCPSSSSPSQEYHHFTDWHPICCSEKLPNQLQFWMIVHQYHCLLNQLQFQLVELQPPPDQLRFPLSIQLLQQPSTQQCLLPGVSPMVSPTATLTAVPRTQPPVFPPPPMVLPENLAASMTHPNKSGSVQTSNCCNHCPPNWKPVSSYNFPSKRSSVCGLNITICIYHCLVKKSDFFHIYGFFS